MEENSTMRDYLKWRGDLTFEQDPFNDVDNLILAQLAYVDYDGIVSEDREDRISIGEVCKLYWERHTEEEIRKRESFVKLSPFLLKPVAQSRRFGKMLVSGYVNFLSKRAEAQMSAIQFSLEDGTVYVAFRGTDETLIGWKEDFNLSYMSRTEGQRLAVEYMQRNFENTNLRLRVGGHSKGGNFAVYASAFAGEAVRKQIKSVYSNDAPGFRDEIISKPEYKQIEDRTINIIPQDSIIGRLLSAGKDAIVVRSSKRGIMQHDALSWQVMGNRFQYTKRSGDSIYLEKVLNDWLDNIDDEARKAFVDQIFSVLQSLGADTVKDMKDMSFKDIAEGIQQLRDLNKEQQGELSKVLKKLFRSGRRTFYEELEQKDGFFPDVVKKMADLGVMINEAKERAEAVKQSMQAAGEKPQKTEEPEILVPAREKSALEEIAKQALREGIEIRGGETDDTTGEDPQ